MSRNIIFFLTLVNVLLFTVVNAVDLECKFNNDIYYGYTCLIDGVTIDENTVIEKLVGDHLAGQTDENVVGVRFENSKIFDISQVLMQQFRNLEVLNASFTGLKQLNPFKNCLKLKQLIITNNEVVKLDAELFKKCSNLEEIWLQQNRLNQIDEQVFSGLTSLKVLYLFMNDIEDFADNTFRPLVNLEQLWINNLKIRYLNPKWFAGLRKVSGLSLFGNDICDLDPTTFQDLAGLERIDFDYDGLERLDGRLFTKNYVIKEISMRFNKIQAIERNFFKKNIKTLQLLDLRGNMCANEDFRIKPNNVNEMMKKLEICFENYENRYENYV